MKESQSQSASVSVLAEADEPGDDDLDLRLENFGVAEKKIKEKRLKKQQEIEDDNLSNMKYIMKRNNLRRKISNCSFCSTFFRLVGSICASIDMLLKVFYYTHSRFSNTYIKQVY